jgi:hypothetical protein
LLSRPNRSAAVFSLELVLVSILAGALFWTAPLIARWYRAPELTSLLKHPDLNAVEIHIEILFKVGRFGMASTTIDTSLPLLRCSAMTSVRFSPPPRVPHMLIVDTDFERHITSTRR